MRDELRGDEVKRAWVLVEADPLNVDEIADRIYSLNETLTDVKNHIVRADTVNGRYQIVVPIFAGSTGELDVIKAEIDKIHGGTSIILVVKDKTHNPSPPHQASGYITSSEYDATGHPGGSGLTGWNTWG